MHFVHSHIHSLHNNINSTVCTGVKLKCLLYIGKGRKCALQCALQIVNAILVVECVSNGRSRLRQWTLIITTEQDYNKARGSHVTKRGYTEVLAKPTKYSISPITSNNHCIALMQGFFSLCHISVLRNCNMCPITLCDVYT